jgi:aspartyl-tRNA(Asn)/glutamyl-tRNA(Gln) amidotransferase subunit A
MNYTQRVTFPKWMESAPGAEIAAMSLVQAADKLRKRQVSSVELTRACLDRIAALDSTLHGFITVMRDSATEQARVADEEILRGEYRGAMHGIPVAIKDLVDVASVRTTAGSRLFANRVAEHDAPVVETLRAAGAVIVGKTNLHEFAYGGSGAISAFGATRNPHDPERMSGGSSSGSAAALSAGMCFAAIGTDTAGSIRLPAACCGIVGLKPTYGLVSAEGVVPLSESFDHVGPMARTAADAEAMLRVIADREMAERSHASKDIRVRIARKYFFDGLEPEVATIIDNALHELARVFDVRGEIDVPVDEDRTLQTSESYRYHKAYVETSPELYDPQTLARILRGRDVTAAQHEAALVRLRERRARAGELFRDTDVIVTPTTPIEPPRFADVARAEELRPKEILMLRNTRPFNVLGLPTVSVPCGWTSSGMPVGLQLTSANANDLLALGCARLVEATLR